MYNWIIETWLNTIDNLIWCAKISLYVGEAGAVGSIFVFNSFKERKKKSIYD